MSFDPYRRLPAHSRRLSREHRRDDEESSDPDSEARRLPDLYTAPPTNLRRGASAHESRIDRDDDDDDLFNVSPPREARREREANNRAPRSRTSTRPPHARTQQEDSPDSLEANFHTSDVEYEEEEEEQDWARRGRHGRHSSRRGGQGGDEYSTTSPTFHVETSGASSLHPPRVVRNRSGSGVSILISPAPSAAPSPGHSPGHSRRNSSELPSDHRSARAPRSPTQRSPRTSLDGGATRAERRSSGGSNTTRRSARREAEREVEDDEDAYQPRPRINRRWHSHEDPDRRGPPPIDTRNTRDTNVSTEGWPGYPVDGYWGTSMRRTLSSGAPPSVPMSHAPRPYPPNYGATLSPTEPFPPFSGGMGYGGYPYGAAPPPPHMMTSPTHLSPTHLSSMPWVSQPPPSRRGSGESSMPYYRSASSHVRDDRRETRTHRSSVDLPPAPAAPRHPHSRTPSIDTSRLAPPSDMPEVTVSSTHGDDRSRRDGTVGSRRGSAHSRSGSGGSGQYTVTIRFGPRDGSGSASQSTRRRSTGDPAGRRSFGEEVPERDTRDDEEFEEASSVRAQAGRRRPVSS